MALIVEDGSGVIDAESYNTVSALDAYMVKMGYEEWPIPPDGEDDPNLAKKEAMARRAALYLDNKYRPRLSGVPLTTQQGLSWPRSGAVDYYGTAIAENVVPSPVLRAHAELCYLAFTNVKLAVQTEAGAVLKRKKIDVLEWEWDAESYGTAPVFGWVDQMLSGLFGPPDDPGNLRVFGIARA